jgi:hypothetical protein
MDHGIKFANYLSGEICNFTRKFTCRLSRPQQKNFRELVRGMVVTGSVYLSAIAKSCSTANNVRKDVERLSNTLGRIPVTEFTQIHIENQALKYKNEPVLILSDGGDFQKPYAKKMENVCGAPDGSNAHRAGRGYMLQSLAACGTKTGITTPLAMHLFSTKSEDYKGDWHEHKKIFRMLDSFVNITARDRIVVEDRGCDDEKRFIYFVNELNTSFITRIHAGAKARGLAVTGRDGEKEIRSVRELAEDLRGKAGGERVWYNHKIKKDLTSKIAFRQVFLPKHGDIPLYVIFVYSEGYEEPMTVLTDLRTVSPKQAWKHFFFYKKRWEVENFYRAVKQNFSAEKFLILRFRKIQALAFLLMLVFSLAVKITGRMSDCPDSMRYFFRDFCKKEQRSGSHHLDFLAFIREYFPLSPDEKTYRSRLMHMTKKGFEMNRGQLKMFDWRKNW